MINDFKNIGYSVLEKKYYNIVDIDQKRKALLFHQSLVPFEKKDKKGKKILEGRAICLNFDLDNNKINFKQTNEELVKEHRSHFFALKLGAPKDKKKFLSTNKVASFYSTVFKESIEYIISKKNNDKSKKWFSENISNEYQKFLEKINEQFYQKLEKINDKKKEKFFLDYNKLVEDQKEVFFNIKEAHPKAKVEELYNRFLNKKFNNSETKNEESFPSIFIITFKDKSILQYENGKFANDYINLCYYDLLKRFSMER